MKKKEKTADRNKNVRVFDWQSLETVMSVMNVSYAEWFSSRLGYTYASLPSFYAKKETEVYVRYPSFVYVGTYEFIC